MQLPKLSFVEQLNKRRGNRKIQQWLENRRNSISKGLNIGCGLDPIAGLINVDKFSDMADVKADIEDLNGIFPDKVSHIEANHVLEHLSFEQSHRFLQTCYDLLSNEEDGTLVVTCPEMMRVAWLLIRRQFYSGDEAEKNYVWKMIYGSQEHPGMFHHSGYTGASLRQMLLDVGFSVPTVFTPFPQRSTPSLCVIAVKNYNSHD